MTENKTLEQLLTAVANSDRIAFQQLYEQSSAHLYGVLLRMLRNKSQAEDCLQEVYMQIWQRAKSYNADKGSASAWLSAIARYRALDLLRKRVLYSIDDAPEPYEWPDFTDNADSKLLQECLSKLTPKTQKTIIMSYVEGYSHGELAEQLDTPLGTIKSWLRRGLSTLQECLKNDSGK